SIGGRPLDEPHDDPDDWPAPGGGLTERDPAHTQGAGDREGRRGAPTAPGPAERPVPFSPDDGDSGGGGDQGDDAPGTGDPNDADESDPKSSPFTRDAALGAFTAAAASPSFRFEFTAA